MIFGWLAATSDVAGQAAGTGSIQGRVFNPVSRDYVRNAEVRLDMSRLCGKRSTFPVRHPESPVARSCRRNADCIWGAR